MFIRETETILCAFGAKLAEAKVFDRNLVSYSGLLARELLVYRLDLS
jgi:pyruvoyl-dependent arginine decarboxylase (PvlArgDC)